MASNRENLTTVSPSRLHARAQRQTPARVRMTNETTAPVGAHLSEPQRRRNREDVAERVGYFTAPRCRRSTTKAREREPHDDAPLKTDHDQEAEHDNEPEAELTNLTGRMLCVMDRVEDHQSQHQTKQNDE